MSSGELVERPGRPQRGRHDASGTEFRLAPAVPTIAKNFVGEVVFKLPSTTTHKPFESRNVSLGLVTREVGQTSIDQDDIPTFRRDFGLR